jgi:transcriptional regulator GlxA family with amidase domain
MSLAYFAPASSSFRSSAAMGTRSNFIILNRLWAARAALLRSNPESRVKTVAFDHGFWHLGRISRTYQAFFGESPSETIARAKPA